MAAKNPYAGADRGVLQAIGLVIVNFSQLEDVLVSGVSSLLTNASEDEGVRLLATRLNFSETVDLFGCLFRKRFHDDSFDDLDVLSRELDAINERRNHLVHCFWGEGKNAGTLHRERAAIRRKGAKYWTEEVTEADVLTLAADIDSVYWRALEFVTSRVVGRS